ncbi:MAG: hypothetical protein LUC33_04500 [Prevotellaceae bacterium]|nr:hypothetical protein [Prevotellaceae bacterium]
MDAVVTVFGGICTVLMYAGMALIPLVLLYFIYKGIIEPLLDSFRRGRR